MDDQPDVQLHAGVRLVRRLRLPARLLEPYSYWSRSTDPLYTIHCTENWGTCEIEGMQIRIPAGARAPRARATLT